MTTDDSSYQLTLSSAELGWLAGAFGKISLPLPTGPFRNPNAEERPAETGWGQAALQERNLIHHLPGRGWQVDPLAAAIVHWLAEPALIIHVERLTPQETTQEAWIYVQQNQGLWVESQGRKFEFTFFKESASLARRSIDFTGITPPTPRRKAGSITLIQPRYFLPVAWHDRKKATSVLLHAGFEPKETERVLRTIPKVRQATFLVHMRPEEGQMTVKSELLFLASQTQVWGGRAAAKQSETWDLVALNEGEVKQMLLEAVKPIYPDQRGQPV